MSVHLCPRCSTLIESESALFCYNCGQELERGFELLNPSLQTPVLKTSSRSVFWLGPPFLLLLLLLLSLSLFYLSRKMELSPPTAPRSSNNEFISTVSALPISPFAFGKYQFGSLSPATVEFYLESSNPKIFLEKLFGEKERRELEEKVGLNLSEISSFFEPNFAYIKSATGSAFLTVGKDLDFLKDRTNKFGRQERLHSRVLSNYFVVSDSLSLLAEIESVYQKTDLPLSLTARYREVQKALPPEGQIFVQATDVESLKAALGVYFNGKLDSAFESLRGSSFVITVVGGSTVVRGLESDDDQ